MPKQLDYYLTDRVISGHRILGITGLNFDTVGLGVGKRPDELPRPHVPDIIEKDWITSFEAAEIVSIELRYFCQLARRQGLQRRAYSTGKVRSFKFLKSEVLALKEKRALVYGNGVAKKGRPSGKK